jgi:hypothetical protein
MIGTEMAKVSQSSRAISAGDRGEGEASPRQPDDGDLECRRSRIEP